MSSVTDLAATGELRWNVKQSFRDYVSELPDGEELWTGTLGGVVDNNLVFPSIAVTLDGEPGHSPVFKFGGAVRYSGYRGMLRVDLSEPWVEIDTEAATITANIAAPGLPERRATIATAVGKPTVLEDGTCVWHAQRTTLSAAGAALLGSVYPPGTEAAGFQLHVDAC